MGMTKRTHAVLAAFVFVALTTTLACAQTPTRLVMAGSSSGGTAHLFFASLAPLSQQVRAGHGGERTHRRRGRDVALIERGGVQVAVAGPEQYVLVVEQQLHSRSRGRRRCTPRRASSRTSPRRPRATGSSTSRQPGSC